MPNCYLTAVETSSNFKWERSLACSAEVWPRMPVPQPIYVDFLLASSLTGKNSHSSSTSKAVTSNITCSLISLHYCHCWPDNLKYFLWWSALSN